MSALMPILVVAGFAFAVVQLVRQGANIQHTSSIKRYGSPVAAENFSN